MTKTVPKKTEFHYVNKEVNLSGGSMANITFIICTGCQFSGISGLIDCLHVANRRHAMHTEQSTDPLFTTRIISSDMKAVQVSGGYSVMPESRLQDVEHTDVVVVPSIIPYSDFLPAFLPANVASFLDWIVARYKQGTTIASTCIGSFVLAETGLLDGRQATTHWFYAGLFRRRYPAVILNPDKVLTIDRGLICTGAVSAFYYLGLHLIEKYGSPCLAAQCAKSFLVDSGIVSQASYSMFNANKSHGDKNILNAQELIESNFAGTMKMKDLARQVGISPRHFIRRFKTATGETPLRYLQQVRVDKAKDLLETTPETINEITKIIGYENDSSFRKLFNEATGLSPSKYRSQFARSNGVTKQSCSE
jgi:transcriptional regulator GlxA family with amidase domain